MERPTKEEIRELPSYIGLNLHNVEIIEDEEDAAKAIEQLKDAVCLGFDTESKPTFRKGEISLGPTLIQLATESKAFLFPTRFPSAVSSANQILSDASIKKVGFGTNGDKRELRTKLNINIQNLQDLS
ncbi:MAG: hypothetical protein ACJA1X_001236, partial [Bermanella sp.]